MRTKESILECVKFRMDRIDDPEYKPIFSVMMIEHADKEAVWSQKEKDQSQSVIHSGFPDLGDTWEPCFYHSIDDAINVVLNNVCDIQEGCYEACFILCKFPGVYSVVPSDMRMYYRWHKGNNSFVQEEEPEIFKHIAF